MHCVCVQWKREVNLLEITKVTDTEIAKEIEDDILGNTVQWL